MAETTISEERAASYIEFYAVMQHFADQLNVARNLVIASRRHLGQDNVRYSAEMLRKSIQDYRRVVPQAVIDKVGFGRTPDQLESMATNILIELDIQ